MELDSNHGVSPPSRSPLQAGAGGLSPTPELMHEFFGDAYDIPALVDPPTVEPDLEPLPTLEPDLTCLAMLENKFSSPTFSEIMGDHIFLPPLGQRTPSPTFSDIMKGPVYLPMNEQRNRSPTLSEIMGEILSADAPSPIYPEPPSLSTDPVIPYSTDIPWLPEDDFNTMLQLEPKRTMVNRPTALQMNLPSQHLPNIPAANPNFLLYGSSGRYSTPARKVIRVRSDSFDPEENALSSSESEAEGSNQTRGPEPFKAPYSTRPNPPIMPTEARPSTAVSILREKPRRDPVKPWVKDHAVKGLNGRAAMIANYKPEEYYTPLPRTPASWDVFEYTSEGELQPNRFYTVEEIEHYLFSPHHRGLIIWIQKNPSDSARRYPTKTSSRCRFKECFAIHKTINQGQYRVCFDEQTYRNANTDPQHNAGYVHLYCLEKHLDFPAICAQLDVRAENRHLPNEPNGTNRMLMTSERERSAARKFIDRCKQSGPPPDYPSHQMPNRPHEGTLTHLLASSKVNSGYVNYMGNRAASTIPGHLGNLEIYAVERDKTRRFGTQKQKKPKPASRKRAREEEEDSEGEFVVVAQPKKGRRRGTRRSPRFMSSSDNED